MAGTLSGGRPATGRLLPPAGDVAGPVCRGDRTAGGRAATDAPGLGIAEAAAISVGRIEAVGAAAGLDNRGAGLDNRGAGLDNRGAGLDNRGAGLDNRGAGLDNGSFTVTG
jgi:hypothetical protein